MKNILNTRNLGARMQHKGNSVTENVKTFTYSNSHQHMLIYIWFLIINLPDVIRNY